MAEGVNRVKLMVLDGNSIINRAFYGVKSNLTAADGRPTGAVVGFVNILLKLLEDFPPEALCVTFDLPDKTFRHKQYEAYKGTRKPPPEDLVAQFPLLKELLDAMGIPRYELSGFEADDLLGTIALRCQDAGWDCDIVTGDRDSFQLVGNGTRVLHVSSAMGKTTTLPYDDAAIREKYGLTPAQLIDLKALMGDASDNIPGVPGVGEKTALELMHRFGSLEALYDGLEGSDLRQSVKDKLSAGQALAFLSRTLATIDRAVPLPFTPEENLRKPFDNDLLYPLLANLNFRSLITRLKLTPPAGDAPGVSDFVFPPVWEVCSPDDGETLLSQCRAAERVGFFLENDAFAVGLPDKTALCTQDATAGYGELLAALAGIPKIAHDVKDLMGLWPDADGFLADTALMAYLLDASQSDYALSKLAFAHLGREAQTPADKAAVLPALYDLFLPRLRECGMEALLYDVEMPLCRVLADMEQVGFRVDTEKLAAFGQELERDLDQCKERIYALAGVEFNILSPKQLGEVLFIRLGLPAQKKTKTGYSTNVEVLEKLKHLHPVVEEILHYRTLSKLKSTYVDGLLTAAGDSGRIHTKFMMTVTATGRLSSIEPNLQNIPVRTELGSGLRRMFVPENPDWVLVDADYSQIELRVLAHIADDETMKRAFSEGLDIHTATAAQVFGVPPEGVTPLMRRHAKAVNFGIVYGISAFSLSEDIGVSQAEAKRYIARYLDNFSGVQAYMKEIVEQAKRDGYVATLLGRRRYLPELKSANFNMRSFGERVALNAPIQGTAADFIKLAMVAVHRRLRAEGLQARLILQVHDELIVECQKQEAETAARLLTEEMENVFPLVPRLLAEAKWGGTWLDAK